MRWCAARSSSTPVASEAPSPESSPVTTESIVQDYCSKPTGPRVRVSASVSAGDLFRVRVTGGWIPAEAERMRELVNHDDLRVRAIPQKAIAEPQAADAYEPRAGAGERYLVKERRQRLSERASTLSVPPRRGPAEPEIGNLPQAQSRG